MAEIVRSDSTKEDHFDLSDDGSPKVSDTNDYVSVLSVNKYVFMDHAYYGTAGFRDGSYLIPHDREMFYRKRRNYSVFKNFVRPVVNALVDPVFSEEAPRVILDETGSSDDGAPIARAYLDDVDGAGTAMQEYTMDTMAKARLHGVCFTLIDNFPEDMQPATVQEAIDTRTYPYAVRKYAWEVVNYKTDDIGRLQEIWFAEPCRDDGISRYERARCWTNMYSVLMERNKSSQQAAQREWHEADARIEHGLGVIPVVCAYAAPRLSAHEILPDPPLYDIARLNHLIYNKDSEIRDLERSQAFAILYLQSDVGGNITLSNHNAIILPPGATQTPGYISPDSATLQTLVENNKYYMEDLFRASEQTGVHAVHTSQAVSGVALAWKFWAIDNQLKKTSKLATVCEQQMMYILSLYTGEQYTYAVEYPSTFQPGDALAIVPTLKTINDMNPPTALKEVVFKKVAKLLMSDNTDEEQKEVLEAIEAEYEQEEPVQDTGVPALEPAETEEDEEKKEEDKEVQPTESNT